MPDEPKGQIERILLGIRMFTDERPTWEIADEIEAMYRATGYIKPDVVARVGQTKCPHCGKDVTLLYAGREGDWVKGVKTEPVKSRLRVVQDRTEEAGVTPGIRVETARPLTLAEIVELAEKQHDEICKFITGHNHVSSCIICNRFRNALTLKSGIVTVTS